jgi:pimeloyl-ACP methyl ester carboxylesterase
MPDLTINGVRLNYEQHGESGPDLVFIHGYTGDITDWRHQLPSFSPSFRVTIIDNRGHGLSEAPADRASYTVEQMALDAQAAIDALGIGRYHLLGHSMGGAIVQEMALRAGDRLLSLILQSTTDDFSAAVANPVLQMWRDTRHRIAEQQGMKAVSELVNPFPPPPHMPAERLEETKGRMARMSVDAFIGSWEGLASWPGARERVSAIDVPSLVIYGNLDTGFLVEGSGRLAKSIPGARETIIPETAHSPQWERPQLFNAALGTFLNEVSGER